MWPFKKPEEASKQPTRSFKAKDLGLKKRMFNAGAIDRLNASWTTAAVSADQVVFNDLRTLRARSREQAANNDYIRKFTSMVKTNIVGANGVVLQSQVKDPRGEVDKAAQKAIESAWQLWSKKGNCDISGALSFKQMQRMVVSSTANDGEMFVRKHKRGNFGLQLELIDPERVDVSYCDSYNNNIILFGIEFDSFKTPVAYHVTVQRKSESTYTSGYNSKEYTRIPANQMLHIFMPDLVDQKRGIPWTATGLQRMKMLQGYEDAAVIAARIGASKMGFFTSETGDDYIGDGVDSEGAPFDEVEPGVFGELPAGMKFEKFDPDYPKGEFADFMKQCLRGLSSGLGVSYNTLANDLEGVNFSSMRHGAIEEREVWKCLQDLFIEDFFEPVFAEWIVSAYQKGRLEIKNNKTGRMVPLRGTVAQYSDARFQPRRWDWVDPLKDIKAKREEIMLGVTSISAIIREKGGDIDVIREELAGDLAWLKENGLAIDQIILENDDDEGESNE